MEGIVKTAEGLLVSMGALLVMLILLYGVASLFIKFSPQPLSGWINGAIQKSTPSGWTTGSTVS
jgi:hypothetical protein